MRSGGVARFSSTTSAIPPRMATEATIRRRVMDSPSRTMPPIAAMTGTLSCTVAAVVARRCGRTLYQMMYPIADASAPDTMAYASPAASTEARSCASSTALMAAAASAARTKFPAVTLAGSPAPRPRSE